MSAYEYINDTYGLNVKKGSRVRYTGGEAPVEGTVTGTHAGKLKIKLDGGKKAGIYHPTWELAVLD